MINKKLSEFTESEFLEFVRRVFFCQFDTDEQCDEGVADFRTLADHPSGSDLLFYPDPSRPDTPEGVVAEIKAWRAANGKPGFKSP